MSPNVHSTCGGYADLDGHPDLVLGSGHIEADGAVVLSKRDRPSLANPPFRTEADRSVHGDDEQPQPSSGSAGAAY